jgi:hypothetical protein
MGMGFAANYADVIEWGNVEKIIPKEAAAFERQLKAAGITRDDFCNVTALENWDAANITLVGPEAIDGAIRQIETAWEKLSDAFTQATTGLTLAPGYHSTEVGDRYDDVQGGYFYLEGVYQLTPAGKKYADKIERKFFVTLG